MDFQSKKTILGEIGLMYIQYSTNYYFTLGILIMIIDQEYSVF